MGCISSSLLNQDDDEFPKMGSAALGHHFVSLTSTTYGLLILDPPLSPMTPPTPPPRFTLAVASPSPRTEVINSWELMAGLDSNPTPKSFTPRSLSKVNDTENINPNMAKCLFTAASPNLNSLEDFPRLCPPDGETKVVLYTTTLRGVRNTFEACNAVRSILQVLGYSFCERDISMDRGFREELKRLLQLLPVAKISPHQLLPPRLFIKGRYIGSADEVLKIHEEGALLKLLQGLPRLSKVGTACDGCGDVRFLPCFRCSGSCKLVDDTIGVSRTPPIVVRCPHCNENGLVLCPICS